MEFLTLQLAQVGGLPENLSDTPPLDPNSGLLAGDMIIVVAIGLTVLLLVAVWVWYGRAEAAKSRRRVRESRGVPDAQQLAEAQEKPRRCRRRKRSHRPKNPPLSETGGLPPSKQSGISSG